MKYKIINDVLDYIDRYQVVSLCNLMAKFNRIPKYDLYAITSHLIDRKFIGYFFPKDKNPNSTLYFSKRFNPGLSRTVMDNNSIAITKCLTVLESFRKYYPIKYEELGFFPFVIKFGIIKKTGETANIQLMYLTYSDENEYARYLGGFVNEGYDEKYDVVRYIVLEIPGMLNGNSPQQIVDYIPRVKGFALCSSNNLSTEFFTLEQLGVHGND